MNKYNNKLGHCRKLWFEILKDRVRWVKWVRWVRDRDRVGWVSDLVQIKLQL